MPIARLDRTVLKLSGADRLSWFDGLITNSLKGDINFAALLTPQGKIIADFFVIAREDDLLIDVSGTFETDLLKRLKIYKLRADVDVSSTDLSVYAAWDGEGDEGYADPRHPALGRRIIGDHLDATHEADDYNAHRLALSVPDSHWDFDTAQMFPVDVNMDQLNGVDFKKGCFVGQEVVSRMKRKTIVRKRARGFSVEGGGEPSPITAGDRVVGEALHIHNGFGMALMRLDRLADTDAPLKLGTSSITLLEPSYGDTP